MFLAFVCASLVGTTPQPGAPSNTIVAYRSAHFHAWPANNGLWTWDHGKEILVGFTHGPFLEQEGHNVRGAAADLPSGLARSLDGGFTWQIEDPKPFVGTGNRKSTLDSSIDFSNPNFAMRLVGAGYHGSEDSKGCFYYSTNRGRGWKGPFGFNGLENEPELEDQEITSRTRYLVTGEQSALLFMSARPENNGGRRDKTFVAETKDGGLTFRFKSWIVPRNDPYRAVMPAVVQLRNREIIAVLRRREPDRETDGWLDAYASSDGGQSWSFRSRVGITGKSNGNPPALTALTDGRLVVAYGNRNSGLLTTRTSHDQGRTWQSEITLRDDFHADRFGDIDLGYPQITTNHRGQLVVVYYWSTRQHPESHLASTIWTPEQTKRPSRAVR